MSTIFRQMIRTTSSHADPSAARLPYRLVVDDGVAVHEHITKGHDARQIQDPCPPPAGPARPSLSGTLPERPRCPVLEEAQAARRPRSGLHRPDRVPGLGQRRRTRLDPRHHRRPHPRAAHALPGRRLRSFDLDRQGLHRRRHRRAGVGQGLPPVSRQPRPNRLINASAPAERANAPCSSPAESTTPRHPRPMAHRRHHRSSPRLAHPPERSSVRRAQCVTRPRVGRSPTTKTPLGSSSARRWSIEAVLVATGPCGGRR